MWPPEGRGGYPGEAKLDQGGKDTIGSSGPQGDEGLVVMLDAAASDGAPLIVPGGEFLVHADYVRDGPDLALVGPDGAQVLVVNYFAVSQAPVLESDTGLRIRPQVAEKLAGPVAPGQYAQAAPGVAAEPVARVEPSTARRSRCAPTAPGWR